MSECKKIAFFDFDGTITTKDTMLEIIQFKKGKSAFYLGFILHMPWLLAYKLNLIANDVAKQRILRYFFGGMDLAEFQRACDDFADRRLPGLIRPAALAEIARLQAEAVEVVIVSASAANWIRRWSEPLTLGLICTELETAGGRITGRLRGKNCHGVEKVRRIHERWDLSLFREIYAYGDTAGDKPMLALASKSYYKPFRDE